MDISRLVAKKLTRGLSKTDICLIELEKHPGLTSRQFWEAIYDKLPSNWGVSHVHHTLKRLSRSGRITEMEEITSDTRRKAAHFYPHYE